MFTFKQMINRMKRIEPRGKNSNTSILTCFNKLKKNTNVYLFFKFILKID